MCLTFSAGHGGHFNSLMKRRALHWDFKTYICLRQKAENTLICRLRYLSVALIWYVTFADLLKRHLISRSKRSSFNVKLLPPWKEKFFLRSCRFQRSHMLISIVLNPVLVRPKLSGHIINNRPLRWRMWRLQLLSLPAKCSLGTNWPTLRCLFGIATFFMIWDISPDKHRPVYHTPTQGGEKLQFLFKKKIKNRINDLSYNATSTFMGY